VLTAAAWAGAVVLANLPTHDADGRALLFVWHRTSGWWQGVLTLVASALTLVLAVWLPVAAVRRWVPAPWRAFTASVGALLVLALGGWLAVLSFLSLAGSGAEGTQLLLTGADGRRVLVTQDGFDGDVVGVWQPVGRVTWVRDPGSAALDPAAGDCRVEPKAATDVVVCGATVQPLAPPPVG
jgi:hypothetical protein